MTPPRPSPVAEDQATGPVAVDVGLEALAVGELRVPPDAVGPLGLPAFSGEVEVTADADSEATAVVQWHAVTATLHGPWIAEVVAPQAGPGRRLGLQRLDRDPAGLATKLVVALLPPTTDDTGTTTAEAADGGRAPAAPARRARRAERFRLRDPSEYEWSADGRLGVLTSSVTSLAAGIEAGAWDDPAVFDLRQQGEDLAVAGGFDRLLSLDLARVDHMPHQAAAAVRVLADMDGRAVLADEVGLGKTIEAGLVLKELVVRGLVRRILVLAPATLRDQWAEELRTKFDEELRVVYASRDGVAGDRLIMSRELAVRNVEALDAAPWDLVIVDEAHRVARGARQSQELLRTLDTRYLLFLTATPVQNDLIELYTLVELLRPGTFGTPRQFRRRFVGAGDDRQPTDPAGLRQLASQVMVRTTRAQAGLDRVRRHAEDVPVTLGELERKAYELCTDALRHVLTGDGDRFRRRTLAQRLTSSPRALALTARRMATTVTDPDARRVLAELGDLADDFGITKRQQALLDLLGRWTSDPQRGKVLVFTQHTDTLDDLLRVLLGAGLPAVPYHGGMRREERAASVEAFRGTTPVMLASDAGAEGLNLQFANCVVNYDLPWNPMRVEQRIGRVHRVTQTRDVHVANLVALGTVDEQVYRILRDKLRMFELLFGQVTTILGELDQPDPARGARGDDRSPTFEGRILDAVSAPDDAEMDRRLDALAAEVDHAWERGHEAIDAGERLAWLSDRSWRTGLEPDAPDDLRPTGAGEDGQRAAVLAWVRSYLELLGATVIHEAAWTEATETTDVVGRPDHAPTLLSLRLPADLAGELGRPELHLAFSRAGLDLHPEAELCVPGSEVFDELLWSLRERGDLRLDRRAPLGAPPTSAIAHMVGAELIERVVDGPASWSGVATWRVRTEGGVPGDELVRVPVGPFATDPGGPISRDPTSGSAAGFLQRAVDGSRPHLAASLDQAQTALDLRAAENRQRLTGLRADQIAELEERAARTSDVGRRRQIDEQVRQLRETSAETDRQLSEVRASMRAELISLHVSPSDVVALGERWRHPGGEVAVRSSWDPTAAPDSSSPAASPGYRGADGAPVTTLAICSSGHVVDLSATGLCGGCGDVVCRLDGGRSSWRPCPACGEVRCGECVPGEGCPCPSCFDLRPWGPVAPPDPTPAAPTFAPPDGGPWGDGAQAAPEAAARAVLAALPPEVHAAGLAATGRILSDGTTAVVGLRGHERAELVLLRGGELAGWWTTETVEPDLHRLRIGLATRLGTTGDVVVRPDDGAGPASGGADPVGSGVDGLVLRDRRRRDLRWVVRDPAGDDRTSSAPAGEASGADADRANGEAPIAGLVAAEGLGTVRVPQPAAPALAARMSAHLPDPPSADSVVIAVRTDDDVDRIVLTTDGLRWQQGPAAEPEELLSRWVEVDMVTPAGLDDSGNGSGAGGDPHRRAAEVLVGSWQPRPDRLSVSVLPDGTAAATVAVGPYGLAVTWVDAQYRVHRLDDLPGWPLSLAVGARLLPDAATNVAALITALSIPDQLDPVVVLDGSLRERAVSPAVRITDAADSRDDLLAAAARAWRAPVLHLFPGETDAMPAALAADLRSIPSPDASTPRGPAAESTSSVGTPAGAEPRALVGLAIGLSVRDVWATPAGDILLEYDVEPGSHVGAYPAADTGRPGSRLYVDRSRHLVESPSTCAYCGQVTCRHCTGATMPCELCGIPVCAPCASSSDGLPRRCPACQALRPGSGLRALVPGRRGTLLRGEDALHSVTFEVARGEDGAAVVTLTDRPRRGGPPQIVEFEPSSSQQVALSVAAGEEQF